jgi:hypothetical protein
MSSSSIPISKKRTAAAVVALLASLVISVSLPGGLARAQTVPIVFPVDGPHSYTDDFGAPRSGGRTHMGIDIFAAKLTPAVAAEDGYISWWLLDEGSAGNMLELVGVSGYRYWYIHLNNDTPGTDDGAGGIRWAFAVGIEPGAPVRKGQFLGYVGDSGNAEGTQPHLHFEIHYPDGTPLNPYESLNAAIHWAEPDPAGGFAFHEYLTIQNPGDVTATATPRYLISGGAPVSGSPVIVPPRTRKTVRVNDTVPKTEHGIELRATEPVVVERPMYFAYGPDLWTGGHVGVGFEQPQTTFYFAEGYTGDSFEEYITLANASSSDAAVRIEYLIENESTRVQSVTVPAGKRFTVNVKAVIGKNKNVSAVIESDVPIAAERPMYFAYGSGAWTGGHVSAGQIQPATNFYFAEGYTAEGFDEYVTLGNPNTGDATVTLRFLRNRGGPVLHVVTVPAKKRLTLFVPDIIGRGYENALEVSSDLPIAAERPMYFYARNWNSYMGPISGGTVGVGQQQALDTWLFAEGYTGKYFKEYLTIGNPEGTEASVTVEYHGRTGLIKTSTYRVAPSSRFTIDVNSEVGPDKDVSAKVTASHPIVAERPLYFRYLGIWTDGHTSNGATAPRRDWYFAEGYTG